MTCYCPLRRKVRTAQDQENQVQAREAIWPHQKAVHQGTFTHDMNWGNVNLFIGTERREKAFFLHLKVRSVNTF